MNGIDLAGAASVGRVVYRIVLERGILLQGGMMLRPGTMHNLATSVSSLSHKSSVGPMSISRLRCVCFTGTHKRNLGCGPSCTHLLWFFEMLCYRCAVIVLNNFKMVSLIGVGPNHGAARAQ